MATIELAPTHETLLNGSVTEWNMDRAQVVLSWLHGSERWAADVMSQALNDNELSERVGFSNLNPSGARLGTRLTAAGQDPNRICGPLYRARTAEEKHVQLGLARLGEAQPDLILDMHNTVTRDRSDTNEGFVIIPESLLAPENLARIMPLLGMIGLKRVVAQAEWMQEGRLISRHDLPGTKITLEWPQPQSNEDRDEATKRGVAILKRLLGLKPIIPLDVEIFHASHLIASSNDPGSEAYNFELFEPGNGQPGFWPVLYDRHVDKPIDGSYRSENSGFLGLAASSITSGHIDPNGLFLPAHVTYGLADYRSA